MKKTLNITALSVLSAFIIINNTAVYAAPSPTPKSKTATTSTTKSPAIAGLSQLEDKGFTFYYPREYKKAKNSYYTTYYQNPDKNDYGSYNGIGMVKKTISKALTEPKTEDCRAIEKTINADIKKSLASIKDVAVKVTPYSVRTFKKDNFAKDAKKRVVFYGCRIEYQIEIGTISLFSQTKVAVKKGEKNLYVLSTLYTDTTESDEVRKLDKAFDAFLLK